jgi:hypothetical protein
MPAHSTTKIVTKSADRGNSLASLLGLGMGTTDI